MLLGRIVDVAFARGLYDVSDQSDGTVSIDEKVASGRSGRSIRVPSDCEFAGYAFSAVEQEISGHCLGFSGLNKLRYMLVKVGLSPDALCVSDIGPPLVDT